MSQSRRQDREKKKRDRERQGRDRVRKQLWEFNAAERERATWPVERAWVPCPDAWGATGNGLVAVERRQPDGRFVGGFYIIDMMLEGMTMAANVPDCKAGEFANKLVEFGTHLPPFRPGRVDVASHFLWGAYALSVESGRDWGGVANLKQTLALMPKPAGSPRQWADMLWNEMMPDGLRRVIERSPHPSEIPEDKEVMIVTTAVFDADDTPAHIIGALRKAKPDFADDGEADDGAHHFSITRPYPKNHWSPLARLGGRQVLGHVEVHDDAGHPTLVLTGKTLSMTCALIAKLKQIMGETIRLADAHWQDADDFRRADRDPDDDGGGGRSDARRGFA